jgi:hypothetical protein
MVTDGYADQNTKRVDGIFFFVVCGCMFRSVGIWEIVCTRRIAPSRCRAFINQPSCISFHHTRFIHSYSYIFPTTQRIISIKPQSQPQCSTSPLPSSPSLLAPLLLLRRDRPPMPTCKTHTSTMLLFHMLTCAVHPSTRSSRLACLSLSPLSS